MISPNKEVSMRHKQKGFAVIEIIIALVVLGAIGTAIYAYTNVTRKTDAVEQTNLPPAESIKDEVVRQGNFVDGDAVHKAAGQAKVLKTPEGNLLKFENFSVLKGPDVFVYLSKNPNAEADKKPGEFVSLGRLQNHTGDQVYKLPANADEYKSVVIWCRAFGVTFAAANLK